MLAVFYFAIPVGRYEDFYYIRRDNKLTLSVLLVFDEIVRVSVSVVTSLTQSVVKVKYI